MDENPAWSVNDTVDTLRKSDAFVPVPVPALKNLRLGAPLTTVMNAVFPETLDYQR